MFSASALFRLILPLIAEQALAISIGMADTLMVSSVGESAVSAVSLVDSINILLVNIFAALATGGAIMTSQYLGRKDNERARHSAKQLMMITGLISVGITVVCLLVRKPLLRLIFGVIEEDVMRQAQTYFFLTALSYPFIALYNVGSALFRSMGISRVSMCGSAVMNVVNIGLNALLIYGFRIGVAGAGIGTLVSRICSALFVLLLLRDTSRPVYISRWNHWTWDSRAISRILGIGIPTGLENGIFQIGKILLQSLVATCGTAAIAANAIAGSIVSLTNIPGTAVGLAMVTVVGQCVGAERRDEAKKYLLLLTGVSYAAMFLMSIPTYFGAHAVTSIFNATPETTAMTIPLIRTFAVAAVIFWPGSFTFPCGLRAAGDVKVTMLISVGSMILFRICSSYLFVCVFHMGVMGIWLGMYIDWAARMFAFFYRYHSGKWLDLDILKT